MQNYTDYIKQRLSLRDPQKESLDILAALADLLPLDKSADLSAELLRVKELYPTCSDFERDFPSVCFSIATGVGKTRLMGACIAYLYLQKGIRNFFVLAPNLTIYNKLIEDFNNPANPKYVFNGIAEFVHNKPVVITGDNYNYVAGLFKDSDIRINIFNISKFNRDISASTRGAEAGKPPRIKRLSEYLGESYWDYLSKLDDLVLLMDEAHRYHASSSAKAINELQPILGLEFTATPMTDDGTAFRNVVYEYSLAQALSDERFVKNPTIATRKDFDPRGRSDEEIEKIKLEDAVSIHEETKQALKLFHLNTGNKLVKPFILVVCRDTTHAKETYNLINSEAFYEGAYIDKVLQIDSSTKDDDHIAPQFLSLEQSDNPIEIVIHVEMLKEGWDVNNLYTICPLRASNSVKLVEQTIGRGLRLPFNGERTGIEKIDKLTVVAHDNFQRVIAAAQDPNSILNKLKYIEIDPSEFSERTEVVTSLSKTEIQLSQEKEEITRISEPLQKQAKQNQYDAKRIVVNLLPSFNSNSGVKKIDDLNKPEVKKQVMEAVNRELYSGQLNMFAADIAKEAEAIYETLVSDFKKNIIEIPRMDLVQGETRAYFNDFDLNPGNFNYQPLDDEIVVIGLKDNSYETIHVKPGVNYGSPVKMLISELINYPEIDYDENAALLYKISNQAIGALESQLKKTEDLSKTVFQFRKLIAKQIYEQMMVHFRLEEPEYVKPSVRPFTRIEEWNFTALKTEGHKDYREDNFPASLVPKYIFRGFEKACHFEYKFESRSEQTFSFVLENDKSVIKWLRPAPEQLHIWWHHNTRLYEPDFIVETTDTIYMVEVKASNEIQSTDVIEKAKGAIKYCRLATDFITEVGGKSWKYAIIPHDQISKTASFSGLVVPNIRNEI